MLTHAAGRARRIDPSRTAGIQRRWIREIDARFRELKRVIRISIIDNDVFGLRQEAPLRPGALMANAGPSLTPLPSRAFQFSANADKVDQFMAWLEEQQRAGLIDISSRRQLGQAVNASWQDMYIQSAYQKGMQRARSELKNSGVKFNSADPTDTLSAAFNQPFHADRVASIYTRAFSDLKGVTAAMDSQMSRVLADGLARGDGPYAIARAMTNRVDAVGRTRARLIARTETIRAHHVATIQEYRNADVLNVVIKAEWLTAGDGNVCPECAALEGQVFELDEIEPLIPLHPNCRCVAIPKDVTDEET
jgi:SPP1 gp7 family putative phage head morphogenesis protein